jgi:hypothetical protein
MLEDGIAPGRIASSLNIWARTEEAPVQSAKTEKGRRRDATQTT